jgi:hypothetical protein
MTKDIRDVNGMTLTRAYGRKGGADPDHGMRLKKLKDRDSNGEEVRN